MTMDDLGGLILGDHARIVRLFGGAGGSRGQPAAPRRAVDRTLRGSPLRTLGRLKRLSFCPSSAR